MLISCLSALCFLIPLCFLGLFTQSRSLLEDDDYSPISAPAPAPEPSPAQIVFNVMSYGAAGDGISDDTEAFKMAWDAACQSQLPSLLLLPPHRTFLIQSVILTGPCKTNALVFQVEGTIMAPDGPESWPRSYSKRQWLVFYRINGMSMQGGGVIDGRGAKWWELPCKPHRGINGTTLPGPCDSPVAIRFFWCSNLRMEGVKMKNSPQFHVRFDRCEHVQIESIFIKSPAGSPNTDGIHLENTNHVTIYNSLISNGDDCVSIGAGSYNIYIKNITCGPSHGISIGSLGMKNTAACVWNITVSESVIKHSDNGVRIKTWQGGYGAVSAVTFRNILMDTVRNPIIIDQYYCSGAGRAACPNQTAAVSVTGVSYEGIKGTYDVRSPPVHLACSDAVPCTNLTVSDVELLPAEGQRILDPFCWNAYGDVATLTVPPLFCLIGGDPRLAGAGAGADRQLLDHTCP
ncbi:polygalacturonase At1g48100-like [Andrographis paniculata]|uniref:polygalacturonase At1g48100-like n=1 Tax=Andrographis paniculata TaxID=175694 RepID=UPI0021E9065E|nr:polygalacturonase At1g48100-like [Andrographis paniculata]